MLKKLLPILILLLVCPFSGHAQTSLTGLIVEGPIAVRPAACTSGDLFFATDTFILYQCGPTNTWTQIAGGGQSSVPPQGTLQEAGATTGTFAGSPIKDIGGAGTELQVSAQTEFHGPNPEVDIQLFGGRAVQNNLGAPFSGTSVIATCINGNATITLTGAGFTRFQNGDGINIFNCGPTHSMSTPSAPTVTSAIAVANTGTGYVATNSSAGSVSNRCYVVVGSDLAQGLTAASSQACVTNGSSNIGPNPAISVTSCSRSVQTVTCTTSAHTLPVGCSLGSCGAVYISGMSNAQYFTGWFPLSSVADSTHFSYLDGNSVANGATTSATGGQFIYFNSDHLVLPAFTTGVYQYGIYEGPSGGPYSLVGLSLPNIPSLVGTTSYNTWDYYGTTYSGNMNFPYFWPTTAPSSPTNDSLNTTVQTGGGSSSLTLASAPSNNSTGIALFDTCPAATAANAFANNFTGGGGVTAFPAVPSATGNLSYVFNSKCSLTGTVSQSMPVALNDTLIFQGKWDGQRNPNGLQESLLAFGIDSHIPINDFRAYPGIFFKGGSWKGTNIIPSGNNYVAMLYVGGGTALFENMGFGSIQSTDFNGILFYDFESSGSASFGWTMNNVVFDAGPNQMAGASFTPLLVVKNNFQTHLVNTPMCCRGMFFKPPFTGEDMSVDQRQEIQGLTEPHYSFYNDNGGNVSGWATFHNIWPDTSQQPEFTNFAGGTGGSFGAQLSVTGANGPGGGSRMFSGSPFSSIVLKNVSYDTVGIGQNVNVHIDGGLRSAEQTFFAPVIVGAGNSLYVDTASNLAAPTCTVATAGPPFSSAFTSQFNYYPVYFGGGIGHVSLSSNTCTTDGLTQQATLTIPAAIPGVIGYIIGRGGFLFSGPPGCVFTPITSLTITIFQNCGNSLPIVPTGGAAGLQNGQVWGDIFPNAPNNVANALPSFNSSGKLIASPCVPLANGDLCYWNGSGFTRFVGNTTSQAIFEESAAGNPSWVPAPLGSLMGTGQSNNVTTGIQDFSSVTEFRPKSGNTASLPATCSPNPMDVYIASDATPGQNWYFCTSTNVWTQQLNTGVYVLNTYSASHTLTANEQWANFSTTATATLQHSLLNHRFVIFNTSAASTVTIAPDSGNITLNGVTASTVTIGPGLGVQAACDGTNCFAWGIGSSGGGGSGTVSSCAVNGPAYYSALTTVTCISPATTPNGVPQTVESIPSGGVSQPPVLALPGISGRAVSGIASTDTILSTDCNPNRVEYVGSVGVTVTLPTAVTLGVPKCVFKIVNSTSPAQTVTIQPTTWTINGNSTLVLNFGQQLWVYVDPNSATNWAADQTDAVGFVSGAAVPASAKLIGSNSNSQLIAAGLNNTHIYVGNASNLPVDVAVSGDASISNTGAITVTGANGGTFPASANVLGTNGSKQPVTATGHNIALPWICADTSGSGTAQTCNTSPSFTPVAGDTMIYTTTTANTGTGLTINWNGLGAKSVAKWQTSTTLAPNDVRANTEILMTYDGTNIEMTTIGNAPSGGSATPCTTTNLSLQYDASGSFGCVTEFTYASSTITASATGKIDLTSASVTAGFHLPSAAGAAPTNGGIISYDTTSNNLKWGNATNTSSAAYITAAPTTLHLVEFNGTTGKVDDSGIATANVVTAAGVLTNNQAVNGTGTETSATGFGGTAGTVTSGRIACYTASGTFGNCIALGGVIGIFNSSTTWIASGEVTINLDATVNVTFGDHICQSPTTPSLGHDNGNVACTQGLDLGFVKTTVSSVSSATIFEALR